ncbi:hypothetical protein BCR34DRAFT_598351 [Clohesyomyces aquaticus]|uniref:Uncharacterized protein n=1 Tax=Clohesyomyces aquaticus TaxID=1231657 RepID=A0A1Y1ZZD9_9PLEO|nr:hypothetical protein BCR34DRAFT_598351 [Clohesyomyces aquaticus]
MLFLLLSLCSPLVSSRVIPHHHATELFRGREGVPAIGLHLTTSYATAAIRHENETIDDLLRIEADSGYINLMSRWADITTKQNCSTPWEKVQCRLARQKRNVNKWLGRPATPDVGILSAFLTELKSAVEGTIGLPLTRAYPVFPMLPALEEEDIQDALEYTGIKWLFAERRSYHTFWETNAAYAGLGYGLCELWKDAGQCEDQERKIPLEPILFLDFDNSSFAASLQGMSTVYMHYNITSQAHLDLGWFNMPTDDVPRAKFLARIQEVIVDVGSTLVRPPTKIILLGEYADDEDFREAVKAAIWELLEFDASSLLEANMMKRGEPMMLAARGAAEMAGRAEYWDDRGGSQDAFVVEL